MQLISRRASITAFCALIGAMASGCVRTVQAWPSPLTTDTRVTVEWAQPRSIALEGTGSRDSVSDVRALQGSVIYSHGDTLVLRVTGALTTTDGARLVNGPVTLRLDSATRVTYAEVDGWKLGYGILATAVLIFAGLVLSGS